MTADALIDYARVLSEDYPMVFIEDLLDGDDWDGFTQAVHSIDRSIILGDDLIVTNRDRLERAVKTSAVEGFILKPNQVGTVAEALDCFEYAAQNAILAIPSGRSGGVIGDVVMDLAVGLGAPLQKNGAPLSGERIEAVNTVDPLLLLGDKALDAGERCGGLVNALLEEDVQEAAIDGIDRVLGGCGRLVEDPERVF